ncbi:MAG: ribonucleoside triphosphate reductase [bacterium]|nr:ribonucleoside triphosphate reductase [bacterium]
MSQPGSIRKRDGRIVPFNKEKITDVVFKALSATHDPDRKKAEKVSRQVVGAISVIYKDDRIPTVENIQDLVERMLIEDGFTEVAKAYILYRDQHAGLRETKALLSDAVGMVDKYLGREDWRVRENSNMSYSLQGLNNHIFSLITSSYWLSKLYPQVVKDAHLSGDFHIHDIGVLSVYCCGWDLKDLLSRGYAGAMGKVEASPPKHFRTALGQIVNFFYTLQGEAAGAQAFSNFDTLLAPFIRYDSLSYRDVKQAIQEFIFNMNIPTRVGFQCMSEDTEILGKDGWKRYDEVKEGEIIATFNIDMGFIEYLPVENVFTKEYKGKMYNIRNRISDQLISPGHRVVRKKFGANGYCLEEIEKVKEVKSPFIIPIGSLGNIKGEKSVDEEIVKIIAWVVAEGSLDSSGRGNGRISIYQSKTKSREDYEEIISTSNNLGLKYTERNQAGLGEECNILRFDADSTREILGYFNSNKEKGIKFIPGVITMAGTETARLFLETYIKGDGHDGCKITTTSETIKDGLLQVIVNAGFGATTLVRKPDNDISKKDRYIIRVIKHKDTYINTIKEVDYEGVIWCPNTKNETVIAKRAGKIFITGNTPFTNITMDITPPKTLAGEAVIIHGMPQAATYSEFRKEMMMINKAFCEVMMEGDAKGRVFTFPIPTYNITKDFDWENENLMPLWEMTARYGIPYFSNFINSDMDPEDARSMCCRLRLDNRELKKRGGGLFGSNPLTGSIGVVTINLPAVSFATKSKEGFRQKIGEIMDTAQQSLEIKRKVLERFTEDGLYPYARHYLSHIKEGFGAYWKNHFSTIGIVGMNEACLNLLGKGIAEPEGKELAISTLTFMRDRIKEYQEATGNLYNIEATPAEGAAYRLAKLDKERYPDIITAGNGKPYYTNSTHLPVNFTDDLFFALSHQDELQSLYTGGTVLHGFIGEKIDNPEMCKVLVKKISENFSLPYFTITPTFSICPIHGYIKGEQFECPVSAGNGPCGMKCEVYSRIVGYYRPVQQWNDGKQQEFAERKEYLV